MGSTEYEEEYTKSYNHSLVAKLVAEFLGTFFLVFTVGCNVHTGSIGAALSIGGMLMVMIYAMGSVSGAHFNPAVTLAVFLADQDRKYMPEEYAPAQEPPAPFGCLMAIFYMLCQILGGIFGAIMYCRIVGNAFLLRPMHYSTADACGAEILYTWALCYVVLNVATSRIQSPNHYFGLAIGFTVTSSAITIGAVSGCSLNPAVSIGSIVAAYFMHGHKALHFWSFYTWAPMVGAIIAALAFYLVRRRTEYGGSRSMKKLSSPSPPPEPVVEKVRDPPVQTKKRDMTITEPPPAPAPAPKKMSAGPKRALSRQLTSGEGVSVRDLGVDLENADLFCGLKWEAGRASSIDIDASCVKFDKEGRCLGAVYFADKEDKENGIRHSGDQVTGDLGESPMDDETISFKLSKIKPECHFLFFVATIFSSGQHSFQDITSCSARLVDRVSQRELCKFSKEDTSQGNALVIAVIYRKGGSWHFEAVDRGYRIQEHGTYRALEPQLMRLCRQKREI